MEMVGSCAAGLASTEISSSAGCCGSSLTDVDVEGDERGSGRVTDNDGNSSGGSITALIVESTTAGSMIDSSST